MEKFENLSVYLGLAKKTISKFAPQFYPGLRMELNNDDAVSDIAHAIMQADWKWDANRKAMKVRPKVSTHIKPVCYLGY